MEHTSSIPRSNQLKLKYILCGLCAFLFVYGFFLPENWREVFGPFALPIAFSADHVPSIRKAVLCINPTRPEIVYGFLGMAAYIPLIFTIFFVRYGLFDLFDSTESDNVRLIVGLKGVDRIVGIDAR